MDDMISRQEAIDEITEYGDSAIVYISVGEIKRRLEQLPSAEAERKPGRWIPQDHNKVLGNITTCLYYYPVCSECGHTGDFGMNFCPNCGCRMMEVEHE